MIYRGHMIDKMFNVYKKTFPVRLTKGVYWFVAGELLLLFNCVIDSEICVEHRNIYFTVIGQIFQELWQFETRQADARNLHALSIYFIADQVLRVYTSMHSKVHPHQVSSKKKLPLFWHIY